MIRTCGDYGIEAGRHEEHRGAWVGHEKIGAVGVHLSRWITSHGFAFNHAPDLEHFQVIVPCGIADPRLGVTSLEAELRARGRALPETAEVLDRLAEHAAETLGRARVDARLDLRTVSVVPVGRDGRILLLRRNASRGGFWQQVTGRIEPGERPEDAARRELREETGADVAVEPLGYRHAFALDPTINREQLDREARPHVLDHLPRLERGGHPHRHVVLASLARFDSAWGGRAGGCLQDGRYRS
jgi:lipoyl(octanoyl) transferase